MALRLTLATPMYVRFIQCICNVNALCKHLRMYTTLGPYFSYKNLFIRRCIYHESNTFGLPKFSKISFAFNIFVPIPVQEIVYLKVINNRSNGHFCVGNHRPNTYLKKFRRGSAPLDSPGSAYEITCTSSTENPKKSINCKASW